MKVMIITQDEPFYLAQNLDYLLNNFPKHSQIVGCILTSASPFGKKEGFIKKSFRTYQIFGLRFFLYYSYQYIFSRLNKNKKVKNILKKYNIQQIILNDNINSESSLTLIKSYEPDLMLSILGNQIFKKTLISLPPLGILNLHTALLPKYRGLMPTFWVLKNDEKYTGVSVFFVDEGIDSGEIIAQKKVEIKNQTQEQLIKETKKIGMELLIESVNKIHYQNYQLIENNSNEKTYFSFPTRKDVLEFILKGKKFF